MQWHKNHDRCRSCGTTDRPFHARGMCEICYGRYVRAKKKDGSWEPVENYDRPPRKKMIEGMVMYRCARCTSWKFPDTMGRGHDGNPGSYCYSCLKIIKQARRGNIKEQDQMYRDWREGRMHKLVPIEVVIPLVKELISKSGTTTQAAKAANVSPKVLYSILERYNGPGRNDRQHVTYETAFSIVEALEAPWLIEEWRAPDGDDNWSRIGHRSCRTCGTFFHIHQADGYCEQCYKRKNYQAKHGGTPFLSRDAVRWSSRFACCRACQTTERVHKGRGLCSMCYQRFKSNNTLSEWPTVRVHRR